MLSNELQFYFLFVFMLSSVECNTHAVIANYSDAIDSTSCGLTRKSLISEHNCFRWHNQGFGSGLKFGRNVTAGEAPWAVYLQIKLNNRKWKACTGSIIDKLWVLTVAHCLKDNVSATVLIRVITRYNYTTDNYKSQSYYEGVKWFPHPGFSKAWGHPNDIGLIKLNESIRMQWTGDYRLENSICLPERNATNNVSDEIAVMLGWGRTSSWGLPLQMSYRLIDKTSTQGSFTVMHRSYGQNNSKTCRGDSGAALWQYYMGRAVIIGVMKTAYYTDLNGEGPDLCSQQKDDAAVAERVSFHIDWIIEIIKNN